MTFAAALAAEKARVEAAIAAAYADNPQASLEHLWQRYSWLYAAAAASEDVGTIVLAVFQATADGTGYDQGDILVYRQTPPALPEYVNTATGLVVTPDGADLGPVGGSSSAVTVTSGVVTANAGDDLNTSALALESGGNLEAIAQLLTDGGVFGGESLPVSTENVTSKFREAFESYTPGDKWTQTLASGDIITVDGNTAGASYLVISKSPLTTGESRVESINEFEMPFDISLGLSLSQRGLGQEFSIEAVSAETPLATPADLQITSISQGGTNLTVFTSTPHGLHPGMRIGIRDCVDSRLNYPALVVANIISDTGFNVNNGPMGGLPSFTAGPFTSGFVYQRSALGYAQNGSNMLFENTTVTNAAFYSRASAGDLISSGAITGNHNITVGTTASVQPFTSYRANCFQPSNEYRVTQYIEGTQWSDSLVDTLTVATSRLKRSQVVPDPSKTYKLRVRGTNNASLTRPVAQIVSAVKTGTATATITTDTPHGLTTSDSVVIYGIRNIATFPNLVVATNPSAILNATQFTVVIGGATTSTSYGGYVARVNAGNLMSSLGQVVVIPQSIVRTSNVVTIAGSANWGGLGIVIGDYVELVGCRNNTNGASLGIDGAYRVRNIATTAFLELEPIGSTSTGADIVSTNCGGAIIKRTDLRLHFVRVLDFERQRVEIMSRPNGDIASSVPVSVQNAPQVTVNSANLGLPGSMIDVATAAINTTATTVGFTPSAGVSQSIAFVVTAVSGTNPTLDLSVQESDDSAANWFKVYDFPRITSVGAYRSPKLSLTGNRVRYAQTVGGTTPSFTRWIVRNQANDAVSYTRQAIDRTLNSAQALNAVTGSLLTQNCSSLQLVISAGAIATTAPDIQMEGSDDNGLTWYGIGSPLTAVANSTVQTTVSSVNSQLVRARVTTAGASAALNYVLIKGF